MGEPLLTGRAEKGTRGTPLSVGMLSTHQSAYPNAHIFLGVHVHACVHIWSSARHFHTVGYSN